MTRTSTSAWAAVVATGAGAVAVPRGAAPLGVVLVMRTSGSVVRVRVPCGSDELVPVGRGRLHRAVLAGGEAGGQGQDEREGEDEEDDGHRGLPWGRRSGKERNGSR